MAAKQTSSVQCAVFIATSLDGFIARENGDIDWLHAGAAETGQDYGYQAFFDSVDALVMGRKTLDTIKTFGQWPYEDKPLYVLSNQDNALRNLPEFFPNHLRQLRGEPTDIINALAALGHRRIYLDGGVTIQRFLRAKLVDQLILNRLPILLGKGRPLFGEVSSDQCWRHQRTESFASGLVQSEYWRA